MEVASRKKVRRLLGQVLQGRLRNTKWEGMTYTFREPFPGFDLHHVQAPKPKMKLQMPTIGWPAPMKANVHQTKPMILSSIRPVYFLILAKGSGLGWK